MMRAGHIVKQGAFADVLRPVDECTQALLELVPRLRCRCDA